MGTISTHSQSVSASAGGTITTSSWFSATDQVAKVYINAIGVSFNTKSTANVQLNTDRLEFQLRVNSAAVTTPVNIAQWYYKQWVGTQNIPANGFVNTSGDINLSLVGGCESLIIPYDIGTSYYNTAQQDIANITRGVHEIIHDNKMFSGQGAVNYRQRLDGPSLPAGTTPDWALVALTRYAIPEYFYLNKGDNLTFSGTNLIGNALFHFTVVSEGN